MKLRKRKKTRQEKPPRPLTGPSILANPAFVFGGAWALTLGLFSLQMTTQIVPANTPGLAMIGGNLVFAILLGGFFSMVKLKSARPFDALDLSILDRFVSRMRTIWIFGTIIEIFVSGGLPLQWALTGSGFDKDYTDFGIPSVHGLMNAMYLQMMASYFLMWFVAKDAAKKKLFLLFLLWPVCMLGRGIFLSVIVQCLAVFLILYRVRIKTMMSLLALALGNTVLFGVIGNLRGTSNPFDYLVREKWIWFFDAVPTGFLWVYIYVTSGVNNIFFNILTLEPSGEFDKTFAKLIPSAIREALGMRVRADNLEFADSNLNVSTMYAGVISDFGALGGFFFGTVLISLACLIFAFAKRHALWGILAYSVLFQVLIFSMFYDMFLLLPTIMQVIIAGYFKLYLSKKRSRVLGKSDLQTAGSALNTGLTITP